MKYIRTNLKMLMVFVLLFGASINITVRAQTNTAIVKGIVQDETNSPVAGATIEAINIKTGFTAGALSDTTGFFQISNLPAGGPYTFTISSIGYKTQSLTGYTLKNGSTTSIVVKLNTAATDLDNVVVTALGIRREEKELGYAVSKLSADDVNAAPSNNWLSALSGKAPGVALDKASTGPAGSIRVTIRGESSLNLDNNGALFIVDGVPINNQIVAAGGDAQNTGTGAMPVDFGNGASEINPNDIESVTVLKGPSATALYGSRAANGAIVITTKSGASKDQQSFGVTYSFGYVIDRVNKWPDLQYEYGSGGVGNNTYYQFQTYDGRASTHSSQTWGPRFNADSMFYQIYSVENNINVDANGNRIKSPWLGSDQYVKGFFNTGTTMRNTVTLSGGNAKVGRMRLSYTNLDNKYIVPNTGYKSHSLALSADKELNKYLSIAAKVNYYNKNSDNLPTVGYGASSVMYSLITSGPNIHLDWLKHYWTVKDVQQWNLFNSAADNPYFIAYEALNAMNRNRVFGNINSTVNFNKKLKLMLRSGIDMYQENRSFIMPMSSLKAANGNYREQDLMSQEMNNDFLFTFTDKYSTGRFPLTLTASFGGNNMRRTYLNKQQTAERLVIPGEYSLANARDRLLPSTFRSEKVINSLYGLAQLGIGNYAFVDITGRNDWSSTLPLNNNSYFYPSVATSILLHEIFGFKNNPIIPFAKVRLNYAMVGNDTEPYRLQTDYAVTAFGGTYQHPTRSNNPNLKPEKIIGKEIGAELMFFRRRVTLDVNYYFKDSRDLIMDAPVDPASGVITTVQNAGHIRNQGLEISANGAIIRQKDYAFNILATYAHNRSHVFELAPGIDTWVITNGVRGTVEARPGGTTGAMYGFGFLRAPQGTTAIDANGNTIDVGGKIVYTSAGYPITDRNNYDYRGEIDPRFRGSFGFNGRYKNINLNVLFDGSYGGSIYSVTWQKMGDFGKGTHTLPGRYDGLVGDGVVLQPDGTYTVNNTVTPSIGTYYKQYYHIDNVEASRVTTSYIKFREMSVRYNFPKTWFSNMKFVRGGNISAFGRDLFVWTKYPVYDPEAATLNGGSITPGYETAQFPSTRSIGINFQIDF